jgi:mannose-P-dolichol utilization defect protein 1
MGCGGFLSGLAGFLQVGVAVAIIVITYIKLDHYTISVTTDGASVSSQCLLGYTSSGMNLCHYAYAASGVSLAASAALGLLLCCTCNLCGLGGVLDFIFAALGVAWWAVAGSLLNHYMHQPYVSALPQYNWRLIIIVLAFVSCGLFGISILISVMRVCSRCCGGSSGGRKHRDVEAAAPTKVVVVQQQPPQGQFITASSAYWNTGVGRV